MKYKGGKGRRSLAEVVHEPLPQVGEVVFLAGALQEGLGGGRGHGTEGVRLAAAGAGSSARSLGVVMEPPALEVGVRRVEPGRHRGPLRRGQRAHSILGDGIVRLGPGGVSLLVYGKSKAMGVSGHAQENNKARHTGSGYW